MHHDGDHHHPGRRQCLACEFTADAPNQRWAVTRRVRDRESGKLYLAAILDLYSLVDCGWAVMRSTTAIHDQSDGDGR